MKWRPGGEPGAGRGGRSFGGAQGHACRHGSAGSSLSQRAASRPWPRPARVTRLRDQADGGALHISKRYGWNVKKQSRKFKTHNSRRLEFIVEMVIREEIDPRWRRDR